MPLKLKLCNVHTILEKIIVIGDDDNIYLLRFINENNSDSRYSNEDGIIREFKTKIKAYTGCIKNSIEIRHGMTYATKLLKEELESNFVGKLQKFNIAIHPIGTQFQHITWSSIVLVPYGNTSSYGEQIKLIGKENASRALGKASSANQILILISCHRIVTSCGKGIGRYSAGIERKQWLINHEKRFSIY